MCFFTFLAKVVHGNKQTFLLSSTPKILSIFYLILNRNRQIRSNRSFLFVPITPEDKSSHFSYPQISISPRTVTTDKLPLFYHFVSCMRPKSVISHLTPFPSITIYPFSSRHRSCQKPGVLYLLLSIGYW